MGWLVVQDILSNHRSAAIQQLIADIAEKIHRQELRPGDYLPSAHTLAKQYGVGYVSVIRAFKTLSEAGLIETVQGRGAFVRAQHSAIRQILVIYPNQDILSHSANPHSDWVSHDLLAGMNSATVQRGIGFQLLFADNVQENWRAVIDQLDDTTGIIFTWIAPPPWVMRLQRRHLPYALIIPARWNAWEQELPCAMADYRGGVRDAVRTLLRAGRTRVAFLGSLEDGHEHPRYEGLRDALAEAKLPEPLHIPCAGISREAGREAMTRYLDAQPRPAFDLLVGANDLRTLGAMDVLSQRGIRIPEEVALLGFDDIRAAADAGLSTVRLPIRELGERSVSWLLETVAGHTGNDVPVCQLPCPAVWRQSTGNILS